MKETEKQIQDYIVSVCSEIKYRTIHRQIRIELEDHFTELIEDFLALGLSKDDAINKALEQMGDAKLVGQKLNNVHKPKPDWWLLILTAFFVGVSLLALYTMKIGSLLVNPGFFAKTLIYILLGLIIAVVAYFTDYRKMKPYSKHLYLAALAALIIAMGFGNLSNGKPYLTIGGLSIDIVGISPLLFMIALSGIYDNWDWGNIKKVGLGLVLGMVPAILIIISRSTTTFIVYCLGFLFLLYAAKVKPLYILTIVGTCSVVFGLWILKGPYYRLERFLVLFNPWRDPRGAGYQTIQLNKVLSSAGLFGRGLTLKPGVLPELHTDFILSYIIYTFGWLAGIVLIAAIATFLIRILHIAKTVADSYSKLLTVSFASFFAIQFLWNILMVLGLAPLVGIGLPFISYGGSQLVANMLAIGILSSICGIKNAGVDTNVPDII